MRQARVHPPASHRTVVTFSALLLLLLSQTVLGEESLHINTGFTPPVSTLLGNIIEEAMERNGLEVEFTQLSAERSLMLVASGIDDGECCRIPRVIEKEYPSLVQVPESVYEARFSAFASPPLPAIKRWEDLKPYNTATVTGWKIVVNNLKRIEPQSLLIVDNPESLFEMLNRGRIDIAAFGHLSGLWQLQKMGLAERFQAIDPPLASAPLYLFLHPRHKELAPRLAATLAQMKHEGRIEQHLRRVMETDND